MPRTRLDSDYKANMVAKMIKKRVIELDLKMGYVVESIACMTAPKFYRRMKDGSWTYYELLKIVNGLKFDDKDRLKILS